MPATSARDSNWPGRDSARLSWAFLSSSAVMGRSPRISRSSFIIATIDSLVTSVRTMEKPAKAPWPRADR